MNWLLMSWLFVQLFLFSFHCWIFLVWSTWNPKIAYLGKTGQHLPTISSQNSSNQLKRTRISPHKDKKDIYEIICPYKEKRTKIGRPAVLLIGPRSSRFMLHAWMNDINRVLQGCTVLPARPVSLALIPWWEIHEGILMRHNDLIK